jgi:flagellar biosynthesis component FlhA
LHPARNENAEKQVDLNVSAGRFAQTRPLETEPLVIWLHPTVYEKEAASPGEHPLFMSHLPRIMNEIGRKFVFGLPGPRWGVDRASLAEHSYVFEINGIPLQVEKVEPDARYCPGFRAIESLLPVEAHGSIFSFNPLTGSRDGAWIKRDLIPHYERLGVELWDSSEYIARHLEMVVYQRLASFVGCQQIEECLSDFKDGENHFALEVRDRLMDATRAAHQMKAGLVRTLQLLVAERAPAHDFGTILAVFGEMWTAGCDLTEIVEEIRFRQKEMLPRNGPGTERIELSTEFEATVSQWLQANAPGRVFAVTPRVKSLLLDELRNKVDSAKSYRTAIVVRDFRLRPYVARLVAVDYPMLTVLAERELAGNHH